MRADTFQGTLTLAAFAIRRDRIRLLAWLGGMTLWLKGAVSVFASMSLEELGMMTALRVSSPVMRIFDAPVAGVSVGEFAILRVGVFTAVLFALMSVQTVVRHTRENEQTGRAELIGSAAVGRHAAPAAAILVALAASAALGVLAALALITNGLSAGESFGAGAAFAGTGIAFAGIGTIAAQLSEQARGAVGLSGIVIGFAWLMSGLGNLLGEVEASALAVVPAWLSPLGWFGQVYAFGDTNWWVLALFPLFLLASAGIAFALVTRRDLGGSLLPARRGPAEAPRALLSPLGLAWRLQRGLLLGWGVTIAAFGLVFGAVRDELGEVLEGIELTAEMVTSADLAVFALISLGAAIVAIYTVQALLTMRVEEMGPLESVLATAVSRTRWMISHIAWSWLGTVVLALAFALGAALASGATSGETAAYARTALFQACAVFVLGGLTVAAFGLLPRWASSLSWAALLAAILTGPVFGTLLNMPEGVRDFSPFTHIPLAPGDVTAGPVLGLLAVAVGLTTVGMLAFNRRSLSW